MANHQAALRIATTLAQAPTNALTTGWVTGIADDHICVRGDDGDSVRACAALSCLVQPAINDQVLLYQSCDADSFILAVLARAHADSATIEIADQRPLTIRAKSLTLIGKDAVNIHSKQDIDLSCLANVRINARNIFSSAVNTLLQLASTHIAKAQNISFNARQLLRSHGHHQLISADADVKIDGERINMG